VRQLDLRGVQYDGLFEKEEFARRLADARAKGEADPTILDDFNRQAVERAYNAGSEENKVDMSKAAEAVASDGGLPGGMSPEKLQELMANPELMAMLTNPRLQDVMRKVMTEGPEAASSEMEDPEVKEMLAKIKGLTG
jgi:hypothetical protein